MKIPTMVIGFATGLATVAELHKETRWVFLPIMNPIEFLMKSVHTECDKIHYPMLMISLLFLPVKILNSFCYPILKLCLRKIGSTGAVLPRDDFSLLLTITKDWLGLFQK